MSKYQGAFHILVVQKVVVITLITKNVENL